MSEMTREQQAREAVLKINEIAPDQWDEYDQRDYEYLLALLADTERATLERVAEKFSEVGWTRMISYKDAANWIRKMAKEGA